MTTFTTEDRENASVNKEQFKKNVKEIFGNNKEVKIEEIDEGVYVVEISKKEDNFDMDRRC